ncbi:asparagine synthase (glutamine-hydrolyzing) [Azospirillum cavernae]|uniref:asparagine synthase (glutamine-hydrolyzing) n=1 Tax=Azospirillum cavernae TaxID=2320860 RepID=A0A418VKX9_9PROT|nr:asparagine synthase (glutamine-hydrolyzing) [Azospirillum cavernae]RJF76803.1 asparagine synthase (glutamine-hydrolyzing) [Azospirillum cavernae]
MCGIAGYIGWSGPTPARVEACLEKMGRRGPDHRDHRRWGVPDGRTLVLLHSRLSIIDLASEANQPFESDGRHIVFNGELYNYIEVGEALKREGVPCRTRSDTEVLVRAIGAWGLETALDRCEGMWAFALYDEQSGTLALSRDRFGEKPLYLYKDESGLYFASEVKFLAALAGKSFSINFHQVNRYLVNGYRSLYKTADSFFEGVSELPAGQALVLSPNGGERSFRYWNIRHRPDLSMDFPTAVAGVRERLIASMNLRLRADVPLAFCMSGGIDSNALIGIASRVFGYGVKGFTITNDDERYNETPMVACMLRHLDIDHTAVPVRTADFIPRMRELVRQHDAPVYTISYVAQSMLHQSMAEHGCRIAVSGTAADELFTGYYDHHAFYLSALRDDPVRLVEAEANWATHIKPIVRNPVLQNPRVFLEQPHRRDHLYPDVGEHEAFLQEPWSEGFVETVYTADPLRNRMLNELFHEVVPQILHEDDLNAMYYSIENRSPFLDRALFEFSLSIPTPLLIRDGLTKAVLREAVRGLVPDELLDNRRKIGFNADIFSFFDRTDPGTRDWLLGDGLVYDLLRRDKVATMIDKENLSDSESKFLFSIVSTKLFLEEFGS